MYKKTFLTAAAAVITFAVTGMVYAQSTANPPTSTPGAGCTATANAMRGGNMGASPSAAACNDAAKATTAATTAAPAPGIAAPTAAAPAPMTAAPAATSTAGADTQARPQRVARADRG